MFIKPDKSKPGSKPRQTLAKRIRTLAAQNLLAAETLALRGREFTKTENLLHGYHYWRGLYEDMKSGKTPHYAPMQPTPENRLIVESVMHILKAQLIEMIFEAVNIYDSDKIYEIAEAVKFLKSFKPAGDDRRGLLLTFKRILDMKGEEWPIRKVAERIGWPEAVAADGFSQLRKLCIELEFPLAGSRPISRKERLKRLRAKTGKPPKKS